MKYRLRVLVAIVAIGFLFPLQAAAVSECNLPWRDPGSCATACSAGCASPISIKHFTLDICGSGGAFDLSGTQYETTCTGTAALGASPPCAGPFDMPPLRYWEYDNYSDGTPAGGANSGCEIDLAVHDDWFLNIELDSGLSLGCPGCWVTYQTGWSGPDIDGCIASGERTVAEISDVVAAAEGTVDHDSWYLLTSVAGTSSYDFDAVDGGTGCNSATPQTSLVPGVGIEGRTAECTDSAIFTFAPGNAANPSFCDISLLLTDPSPPWYNESGLNGDPALIEGFQIVYGFGTEPTTSENDPSVWFPTRDPSAPAAFLSPYVAHGTATPVTVSFPTTDDPAYFGLRIIYRAGSVNPSGALPVGSEPQVMSLIGKHCGPVTCSGPPLSVDFAYVTATRLPTGVLTRWSTQSEDGTRGFRVLRRLTDDPTAPPTVVTTEAVRAEGPGHAYSFLDTSVAGDGDTPFYYSVLELTSAGPGDESQLVEAEVIEGGGHETRQRRRRRQIR